MEDLENTWHFSDLGEELEEGEEACVLPPATVWESWNMGYRNTGEEDTYLGFFVWCCHVSTGTAFF